jgi:hypothetical protein
MHNNVSARSTFDIASNKNVDADGADLAVNPPEIPNNVAPSSFAPEKNYTQETVLPVFNPAGIPVQFHGPNGVLCTLVNGLTVPTGTEDAIAYAADLEVSPPYQGFSPVNFLNTGSNAPVNEDSGGLVPAHATDALPNPGFHGVRDAITRLSPVSAKQPTTPNLNLTRERMPLPQLTDQEPGTPPMRAPLMRPRDPVDNDVGTPKLSPAHLAMAVGAVGLIFVALAG